MSHLYFNEGSDYFGKTKSFAPPKKETKHVHVSAADLLHIVFRIENLDSCKSQKEPLEVFCEKTRSLKCRKSSQETPVPEEISVNFATSFLQNNSGQLLLKYEHFNNEARDRDCICLES